MTILNRFDHSCSDGCVVIHDPGEINVRAISLTFAGYDAIAQIDEAWDEVV